MVLLPETSDGQRLKMRSHIIEGHEFTTRTISVPPSELMTRGSEDGAKLQGAASTWAAAIRVSGEDRGAINAHRFRLHLPR